ncbi:MAG: TolC family protein, partial [Lacipirellulaceae bacterium]
MTKWSPLFGVFAIVFSGCAASAPQPDKPNVALAAQAIKQVDYEKPLTPELLQPPSLSELESIDAGPALSDSGLTLPVLEELAFSSNPSVTQAEARVQALRGKLVQVGLPPNPTVGYVAGEIGNDGASGQQGGFVGQEIITASKLQRNRAVVGAEIHKAEQEQAAIIQKVRTDVRTGYYNTLLAQRRVELAEELVRITTETVDASRALLNAEEIPVAGLLQTQVRLKNAQTMARTSKNALRQAWRGLAAVVGRPDLAPQTLVGDIRQLPQSLDWEEQLKRLQTQSPEVAIAMAEVERTRYALDRATVEAIPDINTQLSVQYDDATQDT